MSNPSIPDHDVKCNMCEWQGYEEDLEILYDKNEAYRGCPNCKTDEYLSDIDEECPYLKKDKCTYSEPCPNNLSCKAKNLSNSDQRRIVKIDGIFVAVYSCRHCPLRHNPGRKCMHPNSNSEIIESRFDSNPNFPKACPLEVY